jgi:transcriptional regulator with XRE-family HTH domain
MDEQARFLQWLMEQTSLSQVELAQRLGISASLVSRLVKGERRLTLSMLRHIAAVFDLPQSEVFTRAGVLQEPVLIEEDAVHYAAAELRAAPPESADALSSLQAQLEDLRDPRKALVWSLTGKLPERTIEKLMRLVELELEYHDSPKEG